ncbi:hypothetical protein [Streptomyces sp. YIM 132580]|uniref:hypothetical protein n=1 Tax=Streptomyces sp. YIM 132580 TaxID=2691958 RepID=UPI001F16F796|nr:hypothetical protein [Streptomyces sp. YIM 132580]
MRGTAEDRTLLPEHREETAGLRTFLDGVPAAVEPALFRGPDGATHSLPPEVHEALMAVVRALADGRAVTVAPVNTTLTTQEAADLRCGARNAAEGWTSWPGTSLSGSGP